MERLTALYEEYREQLRRFKSKMKPADGIFGMGVGLGEAPCHDVFAEKLEALLLDMAADPQFADSLAVLEFIYHAPLQEQETAVYWMLMAVHKLTLPLIPRLKHEEAERLLQWYRSAYPRKDWLPPQEQVLKALRGRSPAAGFAFFGRR